jgi:hypothetical protein
LPKAPRVVSDTVRKPARRTPFRAPVLLAVVVLGSSCVLASASAAGATCVPWVITGTPQVAGATLFGISGSGPSDAWAVGELKSVPYILRWDGSIWQEVGQPLTRGELSGVAAITPTDAWAVGNNSSSPLRAVIEHWDGTAWTDASPSAPDGSILAGAVALSSTDIWAAGWFDAPNGSTQPLYEHWDGTAWTRFPPAPGTRYSGGIINVIAAASPIDVWAGGYSSGIPNAVPLIEHWDGIAWSKSELVPPPEGTDTIQGIAPIASDDVWAVGHITDGGFSEHWDGTAWSLVQILPTEPLWGAVPAQDDDAWVVGVRVRNGAFTEVTFTEYWDGSRWAPQRSPHPLYRSTLKGASATSPTDVWAFGEAIPQSGAGYPLILHSSGPCPFDA